MAHNENFVLFSISNHDNTLLAQVQLRFSAGDYQVLAGAIDDGWGWSWTPWVTVTDGPHALELNWQAAPAARASDGVLTFWVDGVQHGSFTNISNDTVTSVTPTRSRQQDDNGTRGTLYFDASDVAPPELHRAGSCQFRNGAGIPTCRTPIGRAPGECADLWSAFSSNVASFTSAFLGENLFRSLGSLTAASAPLSAAQSDAKLQSPQQQTNVTTINPLTIRFPA